MLPSFGAGGVRRGVTGGLRFVSDQFHDVVGRFDAAIDRLHDVVGRFDAAIDRLDVVADGFDTVVDRLTAATGRLDAVADQFATATDPTDGLAGSVADRLDAARRRVDDVRVREHLRRTERALRAADHDHLSADQRRRRERNLDRLRAYRRAGRFPRNERTGARSPVFVGAEGTRCALGHLLAEDGRDDLVGAVMAAEPTVHVEHVEDADDLDEGALLDWLDAQGLTREEAARVQPGYAHAVRFATTCGPVPCWLAGAFASLVGLSVAAASEYVGYRLVGDRFPDNALKRRGALGYVTLMNVFLGALLAALVYALFP